MKFFSQNLSNIFVPIERQFNQFYFIYPSDNFLSIAKVFVNSVTNFSKLCSTISHMFWSSSEIVETRTAIIKIK